MSLLYECAHEIQKATGWSQERISAETGLGASTVSRMFRVPGYTSNEISYQLLLQLHEEVVKSPFPPYINHCFKQYQSHKKQNTTREFTDYLDFLEPLLENHKALDSHELIASGISWLLGNLCFDRAFYLRKGNLMEFSDSALLWYQKALNVLEYYNKNNRFITQKYQLQQYIVTTKFQRCKLNNCAYDEEICRWYLETDYLQTILTLIKEQPWQWRAARDGLIAAALLQDREQCRFFWQTMKKINKRFKNLDFVPAKDIQPISRDPKLAWFMAQIREHQNQ